MSYEDTISAKTSFALTPEAFIQHFQKNTLRVLRAQERMMHGLVKAAQLEMRFGQELLHSRLELLGGKSMEARPATEHATGEIERILTMMREVTEELRSGFTDAARLLSEKADAQTKDAVESFAETLEDSVHDAEDVIQRGADAGAGFARRAAEQTDEAVAKAKKLSPGYGGKAKASEVGP